MCEWIVTKGYMAGEHSLICDVSIISNVPHVKLEANAKALLKQEHLNICQGKMCKRERSNFPGECVPCLSHMDNKT